MESQQSHNILFFVLLSFLLFACSHKPHSSVKRACCSPNTQPRKLRLNSTQGSRNNTIRMVIVTEFILRSYILYGNSTAQATTLLLVHRRADRRLDLLI